MDSLCRVTGGPVGFMWMFQNLACTILSFGSEAFGTARTQQLRCEFGTHNLRKFNLFGRPVLSPDGSFSVSSQKEQGGRNKVGGNRRVRSDADQAGNFLLGLDKGVPRGTTELPM